jgi:hypothetical protein
VRRTAGRDLAERILGGPVLWLGLIALTVFAVAPFVGANPTASWIGGPLCVAIGAAFRTHVRIGLAATVMRRFLTLTVGRSLTAETELQRAQEHKDNGGFLRFHDGPL